MNNALEVYYQNIKTYFVSKIQNYSEISNRQYIMSHFFLCGLSRHCETMSLGSRKDGKFAK